MQAELIQASCKHKAKADESKDRAELTGTIYQLSKGVKSGGASDDLCDALEALHIDPGQQPSKSSVEAANTWFSLEDDQETAEAIALDLHVEILSHRSEDSVDENNGGEDSGDSGCEDESRESEAVVRPPPYAEVAEEFSTLEAKARSSGMEDVSFHLEKARMAWIRAHASSKKGQQQDIRSFFDT